MAGMGVARFLRPLHSGLRLESLRQHMRFCTVTFNPAEHEIDPILEEETPALGEKPVAEKPPRKSTKHWVSRGTPLELAMLEKYGTEWSSLKSSRFMKTAYLANEEIVELVTEHLKPDIEAGRCILEANPGLGYLSRRLLDLGCQNLHLYCDKKSIFLPSIEELAAQHVEKVRVVRENILEFKVIMVSDLLHDTNREQACLEGLPQQEGWADPPQITLFAVLNRVTETGFLRSLAHMVVPRTGLFRLGRVELLVVMSPSEYNVIVATNSRGSRLLRPYNVLYDLVFECERVATVDPSNFLMLRTKSEKLEELYLVRLRPRPSFPEVIAAPGQFEEFVFFVTQGLIQGVTVSKCLDKWIPFAYRKVFAERMKPQSLLRDVYYSDKLGRCSPQEMVELFGVFRNHELFEHSSFRSAIEKQRYEPPGLSRPTPVFL